jgi:hypothetical protein
VAVPAALSSRVSARGLDRASNLFLAMLSPENAFGKNRSNLS